MRCELLNCRLGPKRRILPAHEVNSKGSFIMPNLPRRQLGRMVAACGGVLLLGRSALAQTVPIFDDAPSIEQLRSIMIPESTGRGLSRSIVIQRPDSGASAIQGVSTVFGGRVPYQLRL
jgi:hypothetical protein